MSSNWSSGADQNSIWNSNSPNLNLLRRYSLSSGTLASNASNNIKTSTPIIDVNNNRPSISGSNLMAVATGSATSNTRNPLTDDDTTTTSNKSTCTWQPSADNKYLIGYLAISRQDLDVTHASQLGFQLCGGKPTHDGQLGAIVEHVVPGSLMNIICKLRVGDEIVEWNGFNLRNKRNDEVMNIIESVKDANSLRLVAVRLQQQ